MSNVERLPRETADITNENIERIGAMFPNCLTEAKDERGRVFKAIDFDKLRQELSHEIVEGPQERYQFNWPEKRKAMLLANTPTTMTLRPCREESVNFDTTQNLYIEGDNLEVLKLLRENYLGKVKMIYIDPPYNTGKDSFVYDDDFSKSVEEFSDESEATDEEGNRQFDIRQNNESNGRFHTDWLNMIYPRLKIAKDLLRKDGFLFVSLDDNESSNARKLLDEIFGSSAFIADICHKARASVSNDKIISSNHNHILWYCKNREVAESNRKQIGLNPDLDGFDRDDNDGKGPYRLVPVDGPGGAKKGNPYYEFLGIAQFYRFSYETMKRMYDDGMIVKVGDSIQQKYYLSKARNSRKTDTTWWEDAGLTSSSTAEVKKLMGGSVFDNPKPVSLLVRMLTLVTHRDNCPIILDFFSGSATTAHAVMKLNADDGGKRKFIMVQLPEPCDEESEAAKAGYKNICEIGKERIRRAGKKMAEENATIAPDLDIGFRVLKLDSSNMEDVFYSPAKFAKEAMQGTLDFGAAPQARQTTLNFDGDASLASNIKPGRTAEDLLFQAMLRLNIPLSAKIETEEIHGKKVFSVMDGHLLATFDKDINEEAITAIAKRKPGIFVICDGGYATDNVADNFEQIWREFSPDTVRRVI